jgi:hypothetical protein
MAANSANILAGIGSTTAIGSLAYFAAGDTAGPVAVAQTAEVQTATISGTPTGGTFTLTWQGISSGPQAYNIATAALQTALGTAWASLLHGGTLAVSGSAGTSYVLTFPAILGNVPAVTASATFTGGSSPAIGSPLTETTPGAGATPATAVIPASFVDAGWCSTAGLANNVASTVNKIKAFGSTQILRTIIQDEERTFDLEFLETNPTSIAIYNRLAVGSIVPDANGAFTVTVGAPTVQTYAGIFDLVDGLNHIRYYCPRLQNSGVKGSTWAPGKEITAPVSMTALPDGSGISVYEYYLVNALHA